MPDRAHPRDFAYAIAYTKPVYGPDIPADTILYTYADAYAVALAGHPDAERYAAAYADAYVAAALREFGSKSNPDSETDASSY